MKTETFFLIALVFGVVALLSFSMRANPLYMALNTDSFDIGYFFPTEPNFKMYFTAMTFFIFLPSVYFCIGFTVAGIAKILFQKISEKKG